jgi:hypothetical protein
LAIIRISLLSALWRNQAAGPGEVRDVVDFFVQRLGLGPNQGGWSVLYHLVCSAKIIVFPEERLL